MMVRGDTMNEQEMMQQLIIELRRGTQMIAVLSQLQQAEYGYNLLQSLEKKGIRIEANTLYPLMRRLESQQLLQSFWDTTEARPRKYYQLSDQGRRILALLKQEWSLLEQQMKKVLEESKWTILNAMSMM